MAFSKKDGANGSGKKAKKILGAKKLRTKELPTFTRQMAAMYRSGIPVVQALNAFEEQTNSKYFLPVITGIREHVEAGGTFSDACKQYPEVFDELYTHMLEAGEAGGILAETMARMANYIEASIKMRNKVKSALMYPMIVLLIAGGIALGIIIFLVPVFKDVYADFGATLPAPTRALIVVSDAIRNDFFMVAACVVAVAVLFSRWKNSESGALVWDALKLKFPVFGDLQLKVAMARFAGTYAQLSRSGVPVLKALDITSHALGNKALGKVLQDGMVYVERGEPLSKALRDSQKYPPMLIHMLQAGEQTSMVDDMLENIADMYDDEVNNMLAGLASLIEPLLMVGLGLMVGVIVICLYLPIFNMYQLADF